MIGYTLKATGSNNFSYSDSGWSEGDLWLDEYALGGAMTAISTHGGYNEGLADALYGTTDTMKSLKIDQIASPHRSGYKLQVAGGFNFVHYFQKNTLAQEARFMLVQKIKNCKNDMGDNVMLSLCNCIIEFQKQVTGVPTEFDSRQEHHLTVHIVL